MGSSSLIPPPPPGFEPISSFAAPSGSRKPTDEELEFFKSRPDVGGMAADDGAILLNPYTTLTPEQQAAVLLNERSRVLMGKSNQRPQFALTDAQKKAFADYSDNEQDIRETIVGRIVSGDESSGETTPEQRQYAATIAAQLKAPPPPPPGFEPVETGFLAGIKKSRIWPTGPTLEQAGKGTMGAIEAAGSILRYPFDVAAEAVTKNVMGIPIPENDPRRNALGVVPSNELLRLRDPKARAEDPIHRAMAQGVGSLVGLTPADVAELAKRKPEAAQFLTDLLAKPAELGLGFVTDPSMVLGTAEGVQALKGAAPLLKGANRALGLSGAVSGTSGALQSGGAAIEAAKQGKPGEAILEAIDALFSGGMGALGAIGAARREPVVTRAQEPARAPVAAPEAVRAVEPQPVDPTEPVAPPAAIPDLRAVRERIAGEYEPPELLRIPTDDVPKPLRGKADTVASSFADELAKTGRTIDDAALDTALPEELRPYREQIKTQAVLEGAALIDGQDMIQSLKDFHEGSVSPPRSGTGVKVVESSVPGGFDVVQFSDGNIVGGARVSDNTLNMIGGGKRMGSPVSIGPVYEMLDKLKVKRNDVLTLLGKKSRRTREINLLADEALRKQNAESNAPLRTPGEAVGEPSTRPFTAEGTREATGISPKTGTEAPAIGGAERTSGTGGAGVAGGSQPKALLIPGSYPDGRVVYEWTTPGGKSLSTEFASREQALANRPSGYVHLDDAYQPFKEDVAAVKPRSDAPLLKQVRQSGDPKQIVLRFEGTEEPISLAEAASLATDYPGVTVERLGNDAFLDTADTQKFRFHFNNLEHAKSFMTRFGENVQTGEMGGGSRTPPREAQRVPVERKELPPARPTEVDVPDVTDPYIYGNLDPTKPHASSKRLMRTLTRPVRPVLTNIERIHEAVGPKIAEGERYRTEMWERRGGQTYEKNARLNNDLAKAGYKWDNLAKWDRDPNSVPANAKALFERHRAIEDDLGKRAVASGAMPEDYWVQNHYHQKPLDPKFFDTEELSARVAKGGPDAVRVASPFIPDMAKQRAKATGISEAQASVDIRNEIAAGKMPQHKAAAMLRAGKDVGVRIRSSSPFNASLKIQQRGLVPLDQLDTSYQAYQHWAIDAENSIADARVWGKNGEKLQGLINEIPNSRDKAYVTEQMDRLRRIAPSDAMLRMENLSTTVRGATSAGSLGLGFVTQAGQTVFPMAHAGVLKTANHMLRSFTGGQGITGISRAGENIRNAKIKASASRIPNITSEYSEASGIRGFFNKLPYLKWLNSTDDLVRTVSDPVGRDFIPWLADLGKAGDKSAQRYLKRMFRIDYKIFDRNGVTADGIPHMDIAAKAFSDAVNFRTRTGDIPGWSSHPVGKMAFQFSNFVYQASRHAGNLLRLAGTGNKYALKTVARGLAAGALVGNGILAFKDAMKGYGWNAEDPKDWEDALRQVHKGRRIPLTGKAAEEAPVKNTVLWAAQGILATGVLGFAENLLRQTLMGAGGTKKQAGEVALQTLFGPTSEKILDIGIKPAIDLYQGEPKKAGLQALTGAVRGYVPVYGREAAREMSADAEAKGLPERPGLVGRARDVIQGEQEPMEALVGGVLGKTDFTIPGTDIRVVGDKSQRRKASEVRGLNAEDLKALAAEKQLLLPTKKKSLSERDEAQKERLAKERFRIPLIKALQSGDDTELQAVFADARQAGVHFTRQEIISLVKRIKSGGR